MYRHSRSSLSRWLALTATPACREKPATLPGPPVAQALSRELENLNHIKRLRIHSRLPVVLPERIDAAFTDWARQLSMLLTLVIHSNHIQELDASMGHALAALRQAGVTLLNQAVLLAGINDTLDAQCALAEGLFEHGVLPYYLHQLDPVQGAAHFAVSDQQALSLHQQMRERLPGYLLPELVREIEGEASKTPLKPET